MLRRNIILAWNWKNLIINQSQRRQKSLNLRVWTKENFKPDTIKMFVQFSKFEINLLSANNKTDGQLELNEIRECNCLPGLDVDPIESLQNTFGWPGKIPEIPPPGRPAACGCGPTLMDIWHPALTRGTRPHRRSLDPRLKTHSISQLSLTFNTFQ